jgi:hypothetical protein
MTAERVQDIHLIARLKIARRRNLHVDWLTGTSKKLFLSWYSVSLSNSQIYTGTKIQMNYMSNAQLNQTYIEIRDWFITQTFIGAEHMNVIYSFGSFTSGQVDEHWTAIKKNSHFFLKRQRNNKLNSRHKTCLSKIQPEYKAIKYPREPLTWHLYTSTLSS